MNKHITKYDFHCSIVKGRDLLVTTGQKLSVLIVHVRAHQILLNAWESLLRKGMNSSANSLQYWAGLFENQLTLTQDLTLTAALFLLV